ncbi:O-antigen ligase family protein [Proteiniclasticum ruminis]|uniref:O-Antigen ligase n=1 Tax=Proteiniclasticum ruminis TaxID=398199 RepID=A0A1G8JMM0_9CLOT|nr:O-antigen ligase family protein [Proteiniclasticum ruminis]SDI32455.1 O-Antigen ligase [Proteiniclasticum ruminis]
MNDKLIDAINRKKLNSFFIGVFLFVHALTYPIRVATGNNLSTYLVTGIILIISIIVNKSYKEMRNYIIVFIITILIAINLLITESTTHLFIQLTEFMKFGFIALFLSVQDLDYKYVMKYMVYLSYFVLIIFTVFIRSVINGDIEYMFFGVNMSYVFSAQFIDGVENKKKSSIFFSLISFVMILTFGNRGALLTCLIIILVTAFIKARGIWKVALWASIGTFGVLYVTGGLRKLTTLLYITLRENGVYSYSLMKIMKQLNDGIVSASSGRGDIYLEALRIIKDNNFMPKGLGYYQYVTGSTTYPHNFYIDILYTFGFFSIVVLGWILFILYRGLKSQTMDYWHKKLILVFFIIAMTRLLLSGTFISDTVFWYFLGLSILPYLRKITDYIRKVVKFDE